MQITDLCLDALEHICVRLNPVDSAALANTCTGLRHLYPRDAMKHRKLMRGVSRDILAIKYETEMVQTDDDGNHYYNYSTRQIGDVIVRYANGDLVALLAARPILVITYKFPNKPRIDKCKCPYDGGYINYTRFRRFRTHVDSDMWSAVVHSLFGLEYIRRRTVSEKSFSFKIKIDMRKKTQILILRDADHRHVPEYYPPWFDGVIKENDM